MNRNCRRVAIAAVACAIALLSSPSHAQYRRSGPASGGGLSSSRGGADGEVESYSSSDLTKMGCRDREMRVGRDLYYDCNGMYLKREYVGGRTRYVRCPPPG